MFSQTSMEVTLSRQYVCLLLIIKDIRGTIKLWYQWYLGKEITHKGYEVKIQVQN